MMDRAHPHILSYWHEFCAVTGVTSSCPSADQFGDTPELADELLSLVLSGRKRATCELKRWFETRDEALPKPGDYWIVTNSQGNPMAIIQTLQVDLCLVKEVDAQFAWDEGEGDRSLSYWKAAHDAYFHRQAEKDGFVYEDNMTCVCERFEKVWPLK